jgi:hypothetical protein
MGTSASDGARDLADYLARCAANGIVPHLERDDIAEALKHLRRLLPALEFHLEAVDADGTVRHLGSAEHIEVLRSAFTAAAAQLPDREIRVRRGDEIISTIDLALSQPCQSVLK